MDEKRSRWYLPVELSPCHKCGRKDEIYDTAADAFEMHDLMDKCKSRCPTYADFKRYGINRMIDPSIEEVDCLIEMIGNIVEGREDSNFTENEIEHLEVLSERLSLVLNLEECRMNVAKEYLNTTAVILKGIRGDSNI